MEFGARLKKARQEKECTQENVAKELNVSRQTISSWENERSYPDIASLILLSDFYGLSLDQLLKEDTGMKEEIQKKESLAKINKVWMGSFLVNLLILVLIFLKITGNPLFSMGDGTMIILDILVFANMVPLLYASREKRRLSGKGYCLEWKRTDFLFKTVFAIAIVLIAASCGFYFFTDFGNSHVWGLCTGLGFGLCVACLLKKYVLK